MKIEHHPAETLLFGFAAGELDEGQSLAVATHLETCAACRRLVRALEESAGTALDESPPSPMKPDSFARLEARLNEPARPATVRRTGHDDFPNQASLASYAMSRWKWVAPGVSMRPILLPETSRTRAFLLRSAQGTRMLQHSHSGVEMTCVLSGSFSHEGGRFAPGDFDFGDDHVDHTPIVDSTEECVCLVAMTGKLRLQGFIGKMIQPFIRL